MSVRLNKAIATAGVCSRRKADELIAAGLVTVNGATVTELGTQVLPEKDDVRVRGARIVSPLGETRQHGYVMLHKPVQVVSTASDPEGRITVLDLVPKTLHSGRLFPVGRLDYFSEGLLLLTDDGDLAHRLTHPRYHLPRLYEVCLREAPTPRMLQIMRGGMTLAEGERLAPVDVDVDPGNAHTLRLTLRQGVNRQIRRMCRDLGLTILVLRRIGLGPLRLDGLAKGKSRRLSEEETAALRKAVGL